MSDPDFLLFNQLSTLVQTICIGNKCNKWFRVHNYDSKNIFPEIARYPWFSIIKKQGYLFYLVTLTWQKLDLSNHWWQSVRFPFSLLCLLCPSRWSTFLYGECYRSHKFSPVWSCPLPVCLPTPLWIVLSCHCHPIQRSQFVTLTNNVSKIF